VLSATPSGHSFAINCVLHRVPLPVLRWLGLGHEHIASTMIYTKVVTLDSGHRNLRGRGLRTVPN
jgi:site-specific recombinase XerD